MIKADGWWLCSSVPQQLYAHHDGDPDEAVPACFIFKLNRVRLPLSTALGQSWYGGYSVSSTPEYLYDTATGIWLLSHGSLHIFAFSCFYIYASIYALRLCMRVHVPRHTNILIKFMLVCVCCATGI